jgi:AraC-like DNA-binding protein
MRDRREMGGTEPYIRGCVILGLPEFIDQQGGDSIALRQAAGMGLHNLDDPELIIPFRNIGQFVELAARQLNVPFLMMEWVLNMPPHLPAMQPYITLAKFEKDCRGWLSSLQRYLKFHTNAFQFELFEPTEGNVATVRYVSEPLAQFSRQNTEGALAQMVHTVRHVTGQHKLGPNLVRFQHAQISPDLSIYEKCFGCPVEFNAPYTELIIDKEILSQSVHGNLTLFKSLMGIYLRRQMARIPVIHTSHKIMVSLAIGNMLGSQHCTVTAVAESLDMNSKKLQRLLQDEGTSFSDIMDEVRKNRACLLLTETQIGVAKIAGMLDYAGSPPFTLAFRRWTNQTPLEFRRQNTKLQSVVA